MRCSVSNSGRNGQLRFCAGTRFAPEFHSRADAFRAREIFPSLFSYLKQSEVFAKLSDTSNGGSFVQNYFNSLPIPKFDDEFVSNLARCYHAPAPTPEEKPTLDTFVEWHRERNEKLGIWELDRVPHETLVGIRENII
jgi:hypothetical protein